ncbi:hypothetical protein KIN20_016477 [Parelaphostrongylus tenuis]|uniref:DNA replication factor Dna2 N-terminal domain-containing protein n=1 Tax=Parelaphostrongylus tenuis TaxID=148309 RepID=A0AAD5QMZ3_PARTN|nr:hypothetical protein KIN20_016477 [Parelaphostrongylus tenuis]
MRIYANIRRPLRLFVIEFCRASWPHQSITMKRPLCDQTSQNSPGSNAPKNSAKDVKRIKSSEALLERKASTPMKRTPKVDATTSGHSDFSDWDESPIKQMACSTELQSDKGAEKENSEFENSFDDPVILGSTKEESMPCPSTIKSPKKRSAAIRVLETSHEPGEKNLKTGIQEAEIPTAKKLDSGVLGFPSLNDPDTVVELTVRTVKHEDGLVDLICTTGDGRESVVYLQDQWADLTVEPNTLIKVIGAKPWGDNDWLVSNECGVIVVSPDTLVPCTSITSATWCTRKVVLNERFRGPIVANKAMLIGTVVHELFQVRLNYPV